VNLCFQGVARLVWLQNIDSRDLVPKISAFNSLRQHEWCGVWRVQLASPPVFPLKANGRAMRDLTL
jgi:hypothetical protein